MRGLTIILAEAAPARMRTALMMALAHAALGGTARLFCDGPAVVLFHTPITGRDDDLHAHAGLPALAALVEEALAAGVEILLCQTGLHLAGLEVATFDPRFRFGGMVGLLATLGDDRLVAL